MSTNLTAIGETIDPDGHVNTDRPLPITRTTKVILTLVIDDGAEPDLALASEAALAKDWNREEEDEAWATLQEVK